MASIVDTLKAEIRAIKDSLIRIEVTLNEAAKNPQVRPLLSVGDVATLLSVSTRTVENMISEGEIRPLMIGRQRRFDPDTITAYIRSKTT